MVKAFINKIKQIVLNHIEDDHFGVKELSKQLGLSQSQTLRKVKSKTGKTVSQLIKEIRLEQSVKLIQQGEFSASEIAYKVGFSSPSYFNKCFHESFGITPGDYKLQNETIPFLDDIVQVPFHKEKIKNSKKILTLILTIFIVILGFLFYLKIFIPTIDSKTNNYSIAVLAFTDLSPNQDKEWFSDGISEDIINLLFNIPGLSVVSRTSSFSYKDKSKTIKKIGKELKVTHILEGSVRKFDDDLYIQAKLVNVKDGSISWSDTYTCNIDELFHVQQEIAHKVIKELKIIFLLDEVKINASNPMAYNLYLKAKFLYEQQNIDGYIKSEQIVNQSINIDSTFAPAWNLLSKVVYESSIILNLKPKKEGLMLSKKAALKALELNKEYASAYASLCKINLLQWEFDQANININKAMKLDNRDPYILYVAALNAQYSGRLKESINLFLQALKMDPFNCRYYLNIGIVYYLLDQLDAAAINLKKYNCDKIDTPFYHAYLSRILIQQGKKLEALKESEKETNEFWHLYTKIFAVYTLGRTKEADSLLTIFDNKYGNSRPAVLASLYAFRKEKDKAFILLDIALNKPDMDLIEVLQYPAFKFLYTDPRWMFIITKMSLPRDHWLLEKEKLTSIN